MYWTFVASKPYRYEIFLRDRPALLPTQILYKGNPISLLG